MGKEDNFGDKINSNGFDKRPEDATKGGKPISFKKEAAQMLGEDGEFIILKSALVKEKTIEDKEYYVFKIPKIQQLTFKLLTLAMSSRKDAFNALKFLIEMFDGKAKQAVDVAHTGEINSGLNITVQNKETSDILKKFDEE